MTRRHRLLRWATVAGTSGLLGSGLASPDHLPAPVQRTIEAAVDGAAHFWLWVMNEPRSDFDVMTSFAPGVPVRVG